MTFLLSAILLGQLQPLPDQVQFTLGCRGPLFRFLVKGVQNIHGTGQSDRVNGTVGVAVVVFDNFEDAGHLWAGVSTASPAAGIQHSGGARISISPGVMSSAKLPKSWRMSPAMPSAR